MEMRFASQAGFMRRLTSSLGTRGSGKSTILKQMKIYQDDLSTAELVDFCPTVYKNVLESAQAVVTYMRQAGLECAYAANNMHCNKILNYKLEPTPDLARTTQFDFPPDIADAIHQLWEDPVMPNIMNDHMGKFYLMDNAP